MEALYGFLCIVALIAFGVVLGRSTAKPKNKILGTLQIDHSDPEMAYLFLLDYDIDYIATKKQATFEIKVENVISQK